MKAEEGIDTKQTEQMNQIEYEELISFVNKCGFKYTLPLKSELTDSPFDKVLCFGIVSPGSGSRLSYTTDIFKIVISRPSDKDPKAKQIPEITKRILNYYGDKIKLVYDTDHSRSEYATALIKMKSDVLKDVMLVLNHFYTKSDNLLESIDYIMDYSPDFVIDRKLIPKKYADKIKPTIYSTVVVMPYIQDVPEEVTKYIDSTNKHGGYILAGGKNRRDYSNIIKACNHLRVNLLICDTNLTKHKIIETKYVKTMTVTPKVFNHLIKHSLFVVCPAINNVPTPVGITVICKSHIIGKICVSTVNTGIEPFIEHMKTGYIVPNTVRNFKSTITKLLNPKIRLRMERNIDKIKYTEKGAKERTENFITKLLE